MSTIKEPMTSSPPLAAILTDKADRIATVQRIWLDDTRQAVDWILIHGHDPAHIGANAWATACRQALRWPTHYNPGHQMDTPEQIRVLHHIITHPDNHTSPGLLNQILEGAVLRAGLVIGAPLKCGRTGCVGFILPGTIRCETCRAGVDGVDGVDLCRNQNCRVVLEAGNTRRGLCDACRRYEDRNGRMRDPRQECDHPKVRVTDGSNRGVCVTCGTEGLLVG